MYIPKPASLGPEELEAIQSLERKLGHMCLIAVKKEDALFMLEAKKAPNQWESVATGYPEIEHLKAYYVII